jgi:AcrR family transcriptional regulator
MTDERLHSPHGDSPDLGSAAKAFAEAAGTLTKALASSFQEAQPYLSDSIANGLRDAAESLTHASASVKTSASTFAARRRAERTAKTRADLLAAAARVIAAQGFDAASVDEIAGAAGYTKGAFYSQFGSKEDLFTSLAEIHLASLFPTEPDDASNPEPAAAPAAPPAPAPLSNAEILLTFEVLARALRHAEFADRIAPALDALIGRIATLDSSVAPTRPRADQAASKGTQAPQATPWTASQGGGPIDGTAAPSPAGEDANGPEDIAIGHLALVTAVPALITALNPAAPRSRADAVTQRLAALLTPTGASSPTV